MSVQYHVQLSQEDLGGAIYAILPGDPGRVADIALALDGNATPLSAHREYHSYLSKVAGQPILVCSTGIGGPSTAICLEELAKIGITHCLRVGTSGSIQPQVKVGDFIITQASVRMDGASTHYAPLAYPAVASHSMTQSLLQAMQKLEVNNAHLGITASSDTFYPGQERYDSFTGYVPRMMQGTLKEWQKLNVLNYEMESATLLTLAKVFGIEAACFTQVVAHRVASETVDVDAYHATSELRNAIIHETLLQEFASHE